MIAYPKKAGLLGWPVSHSLSPALHHYWLKQYGIEGSYELLPTKAQDLEEVIRTLPRKGFAGANVTVPHKESAAKQMDQLDDVAASLGAVNLIIVGDDGSLEGRNTDGFGFVENLKAAASDLTFKGARVVILGAGGTTKAVAQALLKEGVTLRITNRTEEKAKALAAQLGSAIEIVPWPERNQALKSASLLVNTTSLGMKAQTTLEIELKGLAPGAVVADCVYAPLETELLKAARDQGFLPVDGLGMLIHQARPAFRAWFGVDPQVTPDLRDHLIRVQRGMNL
ncbi:shikimate dehydrogenase [bacterium AH-315-P15]|nr:shikimate dehydrogenase [bacterium AH-315-P15]